ncbi:transposase [Ruoffia tabacinasalis]|uniref:Transposase n=1 Tax=Ruoffia tabacinasalis TaxID=87458 RepID=A0ABS0LLC4_9LACT|nr:transposase [Ruoffia tabacinasalis]MBG9979095.1 transposase [Ruoffia tabacinasalis]
MYSNMKHTVAELEFYILQYLEGMTFPMLKNLGLQYENTYFSFEVRLYQQHGIDSLQPPNKNQHYSTEFREQVVQEHLVDKISINELAIKYNIPSRKTIHSWIFRYTNGGESQSCNSKPEVYLMKGKKRLTKKKLKK